MLKTFFYKLCIDHTKKLMKPYQTLDKGSICKLLCWGECPPRSRNTGGGPIKWLLLKKKIVSAHIHAHPN